MKNLFVVGSLHLDVMVKSPRIPKKDETIIGSAVKCCFRQRGQSSNSSRPKWCIDILCGTSGIDSFADLLTKQLEGSSVNFSALQVGPGASGMSVAIVEASGEYGAAVVSGENTNINETLIKIPENTEVLLLQNEISETVI